MPDEKCPNCGALGTVRGPHDPDCPLHPAYAMKDAGKPLFVVERGPVEDPKPAGSVEVSECKACLARTVGADAEIAHKDWCPLLAGPKVGDVVYLRSDRHYDTPMVVKEVQTNNGYLGTAWLDPSKQICTWFAPADCFMPKPRARVGHREDLGDVRRNNSRPSADGDW